MRKASEPFLLVQVHYVGYRLRWQVRYLENRPRLRLGLFSRYRTATSDDILYIEPGVNSDLGNGSFWVEIRDAKHVDQSSHLYM